MTVKQIPEDYQGMSWISITLKLKRILDRDGIGFIVVGSLADYLLGLDFIRLRDIDILVSSSDAKRMRVARLTLFNVFILK